MSEVIASGIITAENLRDYLETFTLVAEARLHLNDDGLRASFVDPANVCMISPLTLSADAFESYDAPGSATIGAPITKLVERLKPADADSLVEFSVDMETRMLRVEYGRADQRVELIDLEAIREEPSTSDVDLPNTVTITGEAFRDALEIVGLVGDHVTIRGHPDERAFSMHGQGDTDESTVEFGDADVLDANVVEATESVFNLDYLTDLADPIPAESEVTVWFAHEHPIRIEWGGVEGALHATAMLAPLIQSQ